jgi:transcriptional regulator with XRE-family HTH domain
MNNYGVILKKLRLVNRLTIKEAAKKIGKSTGWICEIENAKGAVRIWPEEFERLVTAYGGDGYRKQFGAWVAKASLQDRNGSFSLSFGGSVLKYLRTKKEMSLAEAASIAGLTASYLSYLETGKKRLSPALRDRLMKVYGYSPSSFKNFASEDKRAKNIPVRFKLDTLLRHLDEAKIEKIFEYAMETMQSKVAA